MSETGNHSGMLIEKIENNKIDHFSHIFNKQFKFHIRWICASIVLPFFTKLKCWTWGTSGTEEMSITNCYSLSFQ